MFDDGVNTSSNIVSFFAGFLHNFRKCLYKENLTIPRVITWNACLNFLKSANFAGTFVASCLFS